MFTLGAALMYDGITNTSLRNIMVGGARGDLAGGSPDVLGGGTATGTGKVSVGKGTGSSRYKGIEICNWIIDIIKQAERDVGPLQPTSGVRHGVDPHTASGKTAHSGCSGGGGAGSGAVDFGGYSGSASATKFRNWLAHNGNPMRGGESYGDMGHFSKDGH